MILLGFFVLLFVLGVLTKAFAPLRFTDRYALEVISKVTTLLITMGLIGMVLYFFSFERIRFFGARFWYPLWFLATMLWSVSILRYTKRDMPLKRQQVIERQEKRKYFPPRRR